MILLVNFGEQNERLDKYLAEKLKEYSRSQIQKMIKEGLILVNGKKVVPHHFLKAGEAVAVNSQQLTVTKIENEVFNSIKIIEETPDFLVIEKPAGLLVHPDTVHQEKTLIDWLIERIPTITKVGDDPQRPGVVHRLDRDVSGVMVIAKTQKMFECLKNQFKTRKVKKEYQALVYGIIKQDDGVIDTYLKRQRQTGMMVVCDSQEGARRAITEYKVLRRFQKHTLLELVLKTGRTHQLRVHLKSLGHSIVGDKLYQTQDVRNLKEKRVLARLFLHAVSLTFKDLSDREQTFESALPEELKNYLKNIK